jgi:hypothetical protein
LGATFFTTFFGAGLPPRPSAFFGVGLLAITRGEMRAAGTSTETARSGSGAT